MPDRPLPFTPSDIEDPIYRTKFFDLPDIITQWTAPYIEVEGAQILDFGCGEGTTALGLALRGHARRVVGVDIGPDPDLCAPYARQHLDLDTLPINLELKRVEAGRLHNDVDQFDLIYSWSVIEHVREDLLDPTLTLLHDRLRDTGLLFIQIAPLYYSSEGSHLFHKIPERWGHLRHQHSEYIAKLRNACDRDAEYRALVETYETLNRITVPQLLAAIRGAGFTILREHYGEEDFEVPSDVAAVYDPAVVRMAQVVILARRGTASECAEMPLAEAQIAEADITADATALEVEVQRLRADLDQSEARIRAMENSTTWRLAAPFRRLLGSRRRL